MIVVIPTFEELNFTIMNLIFLKTKNIIPTFLHKNLFNIRNSFESRYNYYGKIVNTTSGCIATKIICIYIKKVLIILK